MNPSAGFLWKGAAVIVAGLILLLALMKLGRVTPGGPTAAASPALPEVKITPPITAAPQDVFADVTARAGVNFVHQYCDDRIANILESNGAGGAWLDYDGDGRLDIYLVNSGPLEGVTHHAPGTQREPNRLYRNRGDGTFEDVTAKAGVAGDGFGTGAVAADFDNDGHADLFVINVGRCQLYRNRGDGTFEDVTAKAGAANAGGTGIGAVFFDADNDGRLDLFVANYLAFDPKVTSHVGLYPGPLAYAPQFNVLYRNRGDGTFEDVSARAGIRIPGHRAMSVAVYDHDLDGDQDLFLSNDGTPCALLINDGKAHFKDVALEAGVAFNSMGEAAGTMAAAMGDCNDDGRQDILVTRLGYGSLYLGNTRGTYDDQMSASGLGALTARFVGWGGNFFDFDNDGDLDIFIANGDAHYLLGVQSLMLENDGSGHFSDAGSKGGNFFKTKIRARGSAVVDFDNDGRMDILVTCVADRPVLLRNQGTNTDHWLTLDLEGTRSNRDGFGALVTLIAGGRTWHGEARCNFGFLTMSDRRLHFGLGTNAVADRIEIQWPSREKQILANVKADQILKVREPGKRD